MSRLLISIFVISCVIINTNVVLSINCTNSSSICEKLLRPGSKCINNMCSNPFQQGCLRQYLGEDIFSKKRVCNSQDKYGSSKEGLCDDAIFDDYQEIRILGQNWDSPMMSAWILQIILSELVGVPASIETSAINRAMNFYDSRNEFDYAAKTYDFDALKTALNVGDCTKIDNSYDGSNYTSCAHVVLEVWNGQFKKVRELEAKNIIESSEALGGVGKFSWYVPKFLAKQDPAIDSYLHLTGEENRKKLANAFLRPTTWKDYCDLSGNNCSMDDGVAVRMPQNKNEEKMYFLKDFFKGHFRATEKNNCTINLNCTGHIVGIQCDWSTFIIQQANHLNIAVESDGPLTSTKGYSYSNLGQILDAANATNSAFLIYLWTPDELINRYIGTDFELVPIYLPKTTQKCIDARTTTEERCSYNSTVQIGSKDGACDSEAHSYQKLIVHNLFQNTYIVPEERRSPGYDILKSFRISDIEISQVLNYWYKRQVDTWGYDAREASCRWVAENLDKLESIIPWTYPRTIENIQYNPALLYICITFATFSSLTVIIISIAVHKYREKSSIKNASIHFLFLFLAGLLIVSMNGFLFVIPPSKGICIARTWAYILGYSLELVPLLIKISAINKVFQAASRLQRLKVDKRMLFGNVSIIIILAVIFLLTWSFFDPYTIKTKLQRGSTTNEDIIYISHYCGSEADIWFYVSIGWRFTLMISALVLVFQTRHIMPAFDESYLIIVIYLQSIILFIQIAAAVMLVNTPTILAGVESILTSLDVVVTISLYVGPKLYAIYFPPDRSSRRSSSGSNHGRTRLRSAFSNPFMQ